MELADAFAWPYRTNLAFAAPTALLRQKHTSGVYLQPLLQYLSLSSSALTSRFRWENVHQVTSGLTNRLCCISQPLENTPSPSPALVFAPQTPGDVQ